MKTTASKFKPFYLVTKEENQKVIIVAGRTQVSPIEFNNEKEAEKYLKEQPYEMCINLISILMYYEKDEETRQTNKGDNNTSK